jgi:hypothetical protein
MAGFTKLFSSIVHSTIWRESNEVRLVWVTMMALADQNGVVEASLPGLADAARVSLEECELAVTKLMSPDRYSRSTEFQGRRIEVTDGGWVLLNHDRYRHKMSADDQREKAKIRKRRQRERENPSGNVEGVTPGHATVTQVTDVTTSRSRSRSEEEAEAEAEADQMHAPDGARAPEPTKSRRKPQRPIPDDWEPNPKHRSDAIGLMVNVDTSAEKFRNHAKANDRRCADWNAAFRNWLLNEKPNRLSSGGTFDPMAYAAAERAREQGGRS